MNPAGVTCYDLEQDIHFHKHFGYHHDIQVLCRGPIELKHQSDMTIAVSVVMMIKSN